MKKIRSVLVALDYSNMDDQLLTFSRQLSDLMDIENIHFVHVIPDFLLSEQTATPAMGEFIVSAPIDERVKTTIQKKVDRNFKHHSSKLNVSIDILEGVPFEKILNWVSIKNIDLLITGRKKQSDGSGITAKRVAHHTDCHVLFVPEDSTMALTKIMVPADFSVHSANAIKMALIFKKLLPKLSVQVVHSMRFLSYDYYYGLDKNPRYRKAFQAQKEEEYEDMLKKYDIPSEDLELLFLENPQINTGRDLYEYAKEDQVDLVIMGAKGHTGFKYFFYGSVTERLVNFCEDIPVLVVR